MRPTAAAVAVVLGCCSRPQAPERRVEAPARAESPRRSRPEAAAQDATPAPTTAPTAAPTAPPAQAQADAPQSTAPGVGPWTPPPVERIRAMSVRERAELAVVPFDDVTTTHVAATFREGAAAGLRPGVFAKLGDSITESASFVMDIGHGWYELGPWTRLEPVIQYFRRTAFSASAENNSFTRQSRAAEAGWTTGTLLHGGDDCPVERELAELRPAFAILMIGTNDAERSDIATYERNLQEIIRRVEARKVVLVLSTIPDQQSSPAAGALGRRINTSIRRIAWERHLPLLDFWASMQGLPNQGLDPDNVHPSLYRAPSGNVSAAVFRDEAMAFGYNMRSLTWVLMLERLTQSLSLR